MKLSATAASTLVGLAAAAPLAHQKREVPQEHSHDFVLTITNEFLAMDNPKGIVDAVFGLLGNKAAAEGAGTVTNLDCLKQETADQAFTNAKAASDLRGMAGALLFQAIERNSAKVGAASVLCSETAINPEVAALSSHQDPASEGAAATNKAITLELARQLAGFGADPNLALLSGTFAPGDVNDPTGAGNSCDTVEADLGCIFSQGLLVLDATTDEIAAAVADVESTFNGQGGIQAADLVDLSKFSVADGADAAVGSPVASASASACSVITTTIAAGDVAVTSAAGDAAVTSAAAVPVQTGTATGGNLQAFAGALGGPPPPVQSSAGDRPFSTNGATFNNLSAALSRSCDVQHNKCANAANSGQLAGGTAQCEDQNSQCRASVQKKRQAGLDFGSCSDPGMIFAVGLDGRKEASFAPSNSADFNHGSAVGNKIITSFICGQLQSACKASADAVAACQSGADAAASGTGQAAADAFNSALGLASAGGAASDNAGDASGSGSAGNGSDSGPAGDASGSGSAGTTLDLGSCSDPTIIFAEGLDGRSGAAFAPANKADFDHGSANGIGVITGFICGQLADKCKASADAIAACSSGSAAAAGASGQAAADAFNAAIGAGGAAATGGAAIVTTPVTPSVPSASVVMTITQCA